MPCNTVQFSGHILSYMVKLDEQIWEGGRAVKKENTVLSVLCIVLVIVCLVLASALKTAKADIKAQAEAKSDAIEKRGLLVP